MKTTLPRLIALLFLLLCVLVPACAGALTGQELAALRGERSYPQALDLPDVQTMASDGITLLSGEAAFPRPDEDEIRRLTEQYAGQLTDLGSAVDFLSVFTDDYAGALVNQANHLQSMYLVAEASLSGTEKDMVGEFITQYSQIASSLYSEVEFLTAKLSYAYERIDVLMKLIRSGEYTRDEINAYADELSSVAGEAEARLNAFLTDEDYLYDYFYRFFEASMMISGMTDGMNLQLSTLHDASEAVLRAQAQALYEQENGGGLLRAASIPIAVVSSSQYVVVARDENRSPIEGAEVTVRVLDGSSKVVATLGGKTDQYGYMIFCFDDFRPGRDDRANIDVLIRADGFRTQASGRQTVRGGGSTTLTMEPDDGSPYLIQTTYNHEDIVRVANGIYITPYNQANQRLSFTVNTEIPCTVQLYQPARDDDDDPDEENIIAEFSVNPKKPDASLEQDTAFKTEYTRTFSHAYGSDAFFHRGLPVYTRVIWDQDGDEQKQETLSLFSVKQARVPNPTSANDANVFMNKISFQLPEEWPVIGGSTFSVPVNTSSSNFFFFLGLDGTLYAGLSKTIESAEHSWQNQTAQSQQEMEDAIAESDTGMINAFKAGIAGSYDLMQREHVARGYSASITPYLYAIARRSAIDADDFDTDGWYEYQGGISVGAIAAFNASATFQTLVGPIPAFLSLEFGMGVNFGLHVGIRFDMKGFLGGFRELHWDDDTGFYIVPFLEVAITVGAGIPRLAYIGVQGYAYAEAAIVFAPTPYLQQARVYASVSLEFYLFFFHKSYTLWSVEASYSGSTLQQAVLLSSMAEGLKNARAQSGVMAVAAHPNDPQADRIEKATVRSAQGIRGNKNIDMRFVSVSMKHPFGLGGIELSSPQDDKCLALWIQNHDPVSYRQRIYYTSTQINTSNDLVTASSENIFCLELDPRYKDWDVVDFDVDYFCLANDRNPQPPKLYFAISIVPAGTKDSEIATASRLLYVECEVLLSNLKSGKRQIVLKRTNQMLLSAYELQDAPGYNDQQPGIIMPRIKRTDAGIAIGGIGTYRYNGYGHAERVVLIAKLSEGQPPVEELRCMTPTERLYLYEDWEISEFEMLDRLFKLDANHTSPAYVMLVRNTKDESRSRFYLYPGIVGMWYNGEPIKIAHYYFNGDSSPHFSNIDIIEEYDELYNSRQIGIGALCLQKDKETRTLSTNLFLMTLDRSADATRPLWLRLNPTDTGVAVSADGLNFLEINGSHYAYWLTSVTRSDGSRDYELQASYISLQYGFASQPFTLLKLDSRSAFADLDQIARAALLPITRGSRALLYGVLSGKNTDGVCILEKFSYGIQMSMELTALVPEAPVIVPGETFTSRIAVRNTGMLPIYSFSIDYLTRPEGSTTSSDVFVKQIAVDMQNIKQNEVRNVDQDGTVTSTALQGEAAVYRMDDGSKERNGEIAHIKVYTTISEKHDYLSKECTEHDIVMESLPADGTLDLKTSFTAPLNCWGDVKKQPNVILTARVHNLETGTDLNPQPHSAVYTSERGGAVALNAPLSALSNEEQPAEPDPNFGQKLTLPVTAIYYAPYNLSGARIDTADFELDDNDLMLEANVTMASGMPTVQITLRNLNGTQAEDVVPMLVAMVDGRETWRKALKTDLTHGFTRSLSVPLAELAGGQPYSSVDLYLVESSSKRSLTAERIDYSAFNEANDFDNHRRLYPVYDFYFRTEPQSTTAFVGDDVTLTAEAMGESGPFTYQWVELRPDGTRRPLRGETGTSLTLKKLTLSSNNTKYLCSATNSQGVVLYSQVATLAVSEELPVTGDPSHPNGWMVLLVVSGIMLLALAARRKSRTDDHGIA